MSAATEQKGKLRYAHACNCSLGDTRFQCRKPDVSSLEIFRRETLENAGNIAQAKHQKHNLHGQFAERTERTRENDTHGICVADSLVHVRE